ncbi:sigma-70 family RNA polymerase sigma factor [Cytophagaceae bacterium DM2B3-1]|uniref:Sigma-70 family RNA polymerase sigma factor n=1 Tax=Xanthocytophaga flava TaxID=3048013 RepID=A0ABT7CRB2_9BACT|nr:sigma-70 family RNA polymerase sigma factor [Xanthocytophaga flavus]MDJ1495500.1 sigma-70 family RNA polymerase sigma factor [Xanthocytophaga flavus]
MEDILSIPMVDKPRQKIVQTVKDYSKRLFGFIRGKVKSDEDAEDILQDVWYQLSNAVNIDEIEHMSGWLFQVARNKIIDKHRKKTPEALEEMGYEDEEGNFSIMEILLANDTNPETEYIRDAFWKELFVSLEELPEKQRQVFVWNELEDMTLQEIADKTGENLKTIISRKGYAVKHLRKKLEMLYSEFLNY